MSKALRTDRWSRPAILEAVGSLLFTLYVAWPFLSPAAYVVRYDTVTYSGPNMAVLWRELRVGRIPEWNDQIFGGVPFLANTQTAALYPLKWLFVGLPVDRAMNLITASHLCILAAGVFVLCARQLRLRPPASLIATVAVLGSGLVMVRSLQFEQIAVIAWLPWVLLGIERVIQAGRVEGKSTAILAASTAMFLLAGHPQQTYIALPVIAMWTAARVFDANRDEGKPGPAQSNGLLRNALRTLLRIGLAGSLGALLAAPQLLVIAFQIDQVAGLNGRTLEVPSTVGYSNPLGGAMRTLLGDPLGAHPVLASGDVEPASFVGVGVLLLATFGAVVLLRRKPTRATGITLAAMVLGGLLLMAGPQCDWTDPSNVGCAKAGWPYRFLFFRFPGFNLARVPGRWNLVVVIALALLAAYAVDAMVRRSVARRDARNCALAIAGIAVLAIAVGTEFGAPGAIAQGSFAVWGVAAVLTLTAIGVAIGGHRPILVITFLTVAVVGDLGLANLQSEPRQSLTPDSFLRPPTAIENYIGANPGRVLSLASQPVEDFPYLTDALRPNAGLATATRTIDGYDGGTWVRKGWVEAMDPFTRDGFNNDLTLSLQIQTPVNQLLATRYGVKYFLIDVDRAIFTYGIRTGSREEDARVARKAVTGSETVVATHGPLELLTNSGGAAEGRLVHRTRGIDTSTPDWSRYLGDLPLDEVLVPQASPLTSITCDPKVDGAACDARSITLERPRGGEIRATVNANRSSVFVVAEQWAKGWTATVDGAPVDIQRVDAMAMGVPIEPGVHEVVLEYRAPGLRPGGAITLVAALFLAVLMIRDHRRSR